MVVISPAQSHMGCLVYHAAVGWSCYSHLELYTDGSFLKRSQQASAGVVAIVWDGEIAFFGGFRAFALSVQNMLPYLELLDWLFSSPTMACCHLLPPLVSAMMLLWLEMFQQAYGPHMPMNH